MFRIYLYEVTAKRAEAGYRPSSSSHALLCVPESSQCCKRLTLEIPIYSIIWHKYKVMAMKR